MFFSNFRRPKGDCRQSTKAGTLLSQDINQCMPLRPKLVTQFIFFFSLVVSLYENKIKKLNALRNGVEKVPIRTRGEFFHSIFGHIEKNKILSQKNGP